MNITETYETIKNTIKTELQSRIPALKSWNIIAIFKELIEIVAFWISDLLYNTLLNVADNIFPQSADEQALLDHLEDRGLSWNQATKATVTVRIGSKTLPDGVKPIPQLSIVSTEGTTETEALKFVLLEAAQIDPSTPPDGEGYYTVEVPTQSFEGGAKYNVPAETINQVVTPIEGIDVVYNELDAENGTDKESIASVRQRVKTGSNITDRGTILWFKSKAEDFDGVALAVVFPRYIGNGSVGIIIVAPGGVPPPELITEIQDYFNDEENNSAGAWHAIVEPAQIFVQDFEITIKYFQGNSQPVEADLLAAMDDYFYTLRMGGEIVLTQCGNYLLTVENTYDYVFTLPTGNVPVPGNKIPVRGTVVFTFEEITD